MKERPILFSAPMVRAILDVRKTQTRRIVKPQPESDFEGPMYFHPEAIDYRGNLHPGPSVFGIVDPGGEWSIKCPYESVGDRLWVRETWCRSRNNTFYRADNGDGKFKPNELSEEWDWDTGDGEKWRPSIFMPRDRSRITLEITGVRVERLNEITPADAIAEGILSESDQYHTKPPLPYPVASFKKLWESINGSGSWAVNPWVWIIEFKRVQP